MVQVDTFTVRIMAFGITKEIIGGPCINLELAENSTALEVRNLVEEKFPRLKQLASLRIAVNSELTEEDQVIQPSDELALLPPVSGG